MPANTGAILNLHPRFHPSSSASSSHEAHRNDRRGLLFWKSSRGLARVPTKNPEIPFMIQPSSRLSQVKPSLIRAISEGAPADAIPLGLGEPTWDLPTPARRALERESGVCAYGPNAGLPELRRAIGAWHGASAEETLVTCGSEEALFSLFMAWLNPGDEVLVPDPGFTAYAALARIAGAEPVTFPLDASNRFRLDAKAFISTLDVHPKAKAAIINTPSNPTGGSASLETLREISKACEARGILLISDEVYRDLCFGPRPPSLRDAGSYGVITTSVSKGWGAPGLRVGWAVGDPAWLAPARTLHAFAVTAATAPAQRAALALLEASNSVLEAARGEIRARWEALADAWHTHLGTRLTPPDGSFYHWTNLPDSAAGDAFSFCVKLRDEAKVVLVPGTAFSDSVGQRFARLSFAARPEQLREGVRRLAPFWV
jgi:aspartate/methionine/tyrosine aminotransferase